MTRSLCIDCEYVMAVSTEDRLRAPVLLVCTHPDVQALDGSYPLTLHQRHSVADIACGTEANKFKPR